MDKILEKTERQTIKFNRQFFRFSPTILIVGYLILLLFLSLKSQIPILDLIQDGILKFMINIVFVLALIPMINCGAGMNFGMSLGISGGLVGMLLALEMGLIGLRGFAASLAFGIVVSILFGLIYSVILNHLKGMESIAAIFIGLAFIPLMNIFWVQAPFTNRKMLYPVGGEGLRPKISLADNFGKILETGGQLNFGLFHVPIRLLMLILIITLLLYFLQNTILGKNMVSVNTNPKYATIYGLKVDKIRTIGIVITTVIAGIGICIYSQNYGFVQLYDGSKIMTMPSISALLIGGATPRYAKIRHAFLGTFLYQSILLISVPVANALLLPELAEMTRMLLTNVIILIAFLWEGGKQWKI